MRFDSREMIDELVGCLGVHRHHTSGREGVGEALQIFNVRVPGCVVLDQRDSCFLEEALEPLA